MFLQIKGQVYKKNLNYSDAEKVRHSGFIAQEVEKAAKESGYAFDGISIPKDENGNYSLDYATFVVPLVKAVQELATQNEELQKQIDELKRLLAANIQHTSSQSSTNTTLSEASLEANIANPFDNTTKIQYTLPEKCTNAQIVIADKNGKVLKQVNIAGKGKGTITVNAATMAAGAYTYSLLLDGRVISSRQMVLVK
jgi:hypothetical protein